MAKYKKGDVVTVRSDLIGGTRYPCGNGGMLFCAYEMEKFTGTQVTISAVRSTGNYNLVEDVDGWIWSDGMFDDALTDDFDCDTPINPGDILSILAGSYS